MLIQRLHAANGGEAEDLFQSHALQQYILLCSQVPSNFSSLQISNGIRAMTLVECVCVCSKLVPNRFDGGTEHSLQNSEGTRSH